MHVLYGLFGVAVLLFTCLWNGTGFGYTMSNLENLLKEEENRVFSHKNYNNSNTSSGYIPSSVSTEPLFPTASSRSTTSSAATPVQVAPVSFNPVNIRQAQENAARQAVSNVRRQLDNMNSRPIELKM